MDINKVTLIGRLTAAPQEKILPSGQKMATFDVATNYVWKDFKTKEKKEKAEFHRVVIWGRLAEIALAYLEKASRVYIEGRLNYRKWEDKNKTKRTTTDVIADELIMLGHKSAGSEAAFAKEEPGEKELVVEEV